MTLTLTPKAMALRDLIDELDRLLPPGWEDQPVIPMSWIIDHFPGKTLAECWAIYDRMIELDAKGEAITGTPAPKRVSRSDGAKWTEFERLTAAYHAEVAGRRAA